jgi:hypothetical protein
VAERSRHAAPAGSSRMTGSAGLINCPVVRMMLQDSNAHSHLLSRNQHADNHSSFTNKAQHTRALPCCPLPLCLPVGAAGLSFKGWRCHPGALQRWPAYSPMLRSRSSCVAALGGHQPQWQQRAAPWPGAGRGAGLASRSRTAAPAPTRGHGGPPRQSTSAQRRVTNTHTGHAHTRTYATDCTLHAPRADCVCRQ